MPTIWVYAGCALALFGVAFSAGWSERGVRADSEINKLVAEHKGLRAEQEQRRADEEARYRLREKELQDATDRSNQERNDALTRADSTASALRRDTDRLRGKLATALAVAACGPSTLAGPAPSPGAARLADVVADGLQLQVDLARYAVSAQVDAAGVRAQYERARAAGGQP